MTKIRVEIAYARPETQRLVSIELEANSTVADAIAASRIGLEFPEIDMTKDRVGIFGRRMSTESAVHNGDRVEIYRPLIADPKETRRRRAEHARREKRQ